MALATNDLIVSVSGIRGIIGSSLTPELACRFASAYGSKVKGTVVVSRDSRPSGDFLRHAIYAGLMASGCTVLDIGITPTPTVGIAVRHLKASGGIQITASHNPAPWNGLKMFGADGAVLPASRGREVENLFRNGGFPLAKWDGVGAVRVPPSVLEEHAELVCDQVSVSSLAACRFRVFVDGNGGAGGPLAMQLLNNLGCEIVQQNCEANGEFVHEPEPTPAHLVDVAPWVKRSGAAVGFVLDPDADRLALIDENGECISEELTLALAVKYRLRQKVGAVAVNMSTSRVIEDLTRAAGGTFHRSAVGEANVVEKMRGVNAVIGGEGNGGVIDPRVGWVRDPYIGMALILSLMAEEGKSLSHLVKDLPQYSMLKTKFTVSRDQLASALSRLESKWSGTTLNREDGLRIDGPNWWLHVRASNTEPIVRVIAESPTAEQTEQLCNEAGSLLQE